EGSVLALGGFDSVKDRFRLEHHPGATAERAVVHRPVRVGCVIPEVDQLGPQLAFFVRDPQDALRQIRPDGLWKERQDRAEHEDSAAERAEQRRHAAAVDQGRDAAMFTGLIEAVGVVCAVRNAVGGRELDVDLGAAADGARLGDSVSLARVCCTVTALTGAVASFWLSPETLTRTWFGT